MDILRTDDARFDDLPDWPYPPCYTDIASGDGGTLRMHHVDVGPADAAPILLMHGNPTWGYLYRRMIPGLVAAGHRVVVPDLIGCGRSDKPASKADYTLARHYDWFSAWLQAKDLNKISLFCQDWGGTIGMVMAARHPERFARVITSNTGLPLGGGASEFMAMWLGMMREATQFPWPIFEQGMGVTLTPGERAAYAAPFPSPDYEQGITKFPVLIAVEPDNPEVGLNREAWDRLAHFDKPWLTLMGGKDPVSKGAEKPIHAHIPGAKGQPHAHLPEAHHFIQEDSPDELVRHILAFIEATS
jgi:haloalkane dehalogenase